MIDASLIQDLASQLRRLGVERLEIGVSDCVAHLRLPLDTAAGAAPAHNPAPAATPAVTVRSEGLGLLRLSHDAQLTQAIQPGDKVEHGQLLALLELEDTLTPVLAPQAGTIDRVLGQDGQLADYGMLLFTFASPPATASTAVEEQAAGARAALPQARTAAASASQTHTVLSPMSGTFYRAARPGADALVSVGSRVEIGTPLCVLEAMKMLNELPAEHAGSVAQILCENGQLIEAGQPLFVLALEETRGVS